MYHIYIPKKKICLRNQILELVDRYYKSATSIFKVLKEKKVKLTK